MWKLCPNSVEKQFMVDKFSSHGLTVSTNFYSLSECPTKKKLFNCMKIHRKVFSQALLILKDIGPFDMRIDNAQWISVGWIQ